MWKMSLLVSDEFACMFTGKKQLLFRYLQLFMFQVQMGHFGSKFHTRQKMNNFLSCVKFAAKMTHLHLKHEQLQIPKIKV